MSVVAITRGGFGSAWLFETQSDALHHPLIQYGDAVLDGPDSLLDEYRVAELPAMLSRLGLDELGTSLSGRLSGLVAEGRTSRQVRDLLLTEHTHTDIWSALLRVGREPPESAAKVLELVRCDREWDTDNRKRRTTMAEAAKKEKAPKAEKTKTEKTVGGHPLTTKLDFGVGKSKDKDGKDVEAAYHPDKNNPKRGGAAERFKLYKKGITIAAAIEAGMSAGNVAHDLEKGYVVALTK